jgi:hypothetical protein
MRSRRPKLRKYAKAFCLIPIIICLLSTIYCNDEGPTKPEQNTPPSRPSYPFPGNGNAEVYTENVILGWRGWDADGDTLTYSLYFDTLSDPRLISSRQQDTTYHLGSLNPLTRYYWRVVSYDDEDSTEGSLWWFATTNLPNHPPYKPNNPFPSDGSTEVETSVTLTWQGGDPDPGNVITYDVYFGKDFTGLPLVSPAIFDTNFEVEGLDSNTWYFWKIVSRDHFGDTTSGDLWTFKTVD